MKLYSEFCVDVVKTGYVADVGGFAARLEMLRETWRAIPTSQAKYALSRS